MLEKVYDIKNYLGAHNLIFSYNGPVSQFLVVEIGDIVKKFLVKNSERPVITKIFSILVEQMQNIIRYSEEKNSHNDEEEFSTGSGIITVGIEDDYYFIISGNLVLNEDITRIRERLILISEMDRASQKEYYKSLRRKEANPKSRGAGIGFVEMARKASKPLEYDFKKVNENYTFFSIKAIVKAEA